MPASSEVSTVYVAPAQASFSKASAEVKPLNLIFEKPLKTT